MERPWEADASASFKRRLGKSALELGETSAASAVLAMPMQRIGESPRSTDYSDHLQP